MILAPVTQELIEFTRELGQRFPDMLDGEVILAVEEHHGCTLPDYAQRAMLWEYNNGEGKNPWL